MTDPVTSTSQLWYYVFVKEKGTSMIQEYYKIVYQNYSNGCCAEKRIYAYNIPDALAQAKDLQRTHHDICVLYVRTAYGRNVWL
jgi:hypothetical protein